MDVTGCNRSLTIVLVGISLIKQKEKVQIIYHATLQDSIVADF